MIDFTIKTPLTRMGGLNIGLSAGPYQGRRSLERRVYVTEDAFFFLEGSLRKHCSRYSNFGHWGVTEIRREEWQLILPDLAFIAETALKAVGPEEIMNVAGISKRLADEMCESFKMSCKSLAEMLHELSEWIRESLQTSETVCILGI